MPYKRNNSLNSFYEKHGKTPPSQEIHGSIEDIRKYQKPMEISNWRMQGNQLMGDTGFGKVVNNIPTDYIMVGVDNDGKPILEKIVI